MELTIQKSFEETIQIETPKFYKSRYSGRMSKITETGITKVNDLMIVHTEKSSSRYFISDVVELLDPSENVEISKLEFEERFAKTLVDIQAKAYE